MGQILGALSSRGNTDTVIGASISQALSCKEAYHSDRTPWGDLRTSQRGRQVARWAEWSLECQAGSVLFSQCERQPWALVKMQTPDLTPQRWAFLLSLTIGIANIY